MPADLPDARDHVREPQGRRQHGVEAHTLAARVPGARRAGDPPRRELSAQSRPGGGPRVSIAGERHIPPGGAQVAPGGAQVSPGGAQAATPSYGDVNRDVLSTLRPPGNLYFAWMCIVGLLLTCFFLAWGYQIVAGMGTAGQRTPRMWAMNITSFVFWIGIGHAGTLISAVLYLFRARWRTSIYRAP